MTKVLVFESDSTFASELSSNLASYGCQTSVVDDATAGLSAAVTAKPDLILLSIELPRMNGFSVCNKLKRDPALKDVPLIIMSSDSSEETFEQHRRLRTRAEDYIHKPIAFEQLLTRIRAFLPLEQRSGDVTDVAEEDVVIIDSESFRPGADDGAESLETEVESFAESAFDAIIDRPPGAKSGSIPPPANGASAAPSFAPTSAVARDDAENYRERLARLEDDLAVARSRIAELEEAAGRAGDAHEVQRLRRELEDVRAKAGRGGSSAREFLDLREALNRKDKELLDLRDQLTHRDKELLGLRDSSLALEREKADLADKHEEVERTLADQSKLVEAARADKEQAGKRAEDFKRKLEKLTTEHEARTAELGALRQQYDTETVQRTQRIEELEKLLEESRRAAEEQLERALSEARERADRAREEALAARDKAHEETLSARETELKQESAGKLADVTKQRDEALANLEAQHSARIVELAQAHETSRQELLAGNERELGELRSQKEAVERVQGQRVSDLERELEVRTRERDEERETRGQRDAEISARRQELEALQRELEGVRADLIAERQRLERARAKWTEDKGSLERAKDALAAALSQIEEAESRSIE